jgi:hypothetical protein
MPAEVGPARKGEREKRRREGSRDRVTKFERKGEKEGGKEGGREGGRERVKNPTLVSISFL